MPPKNRFVLFKPKLAAPREEGNALKRFDLVDMGPPLKASPAEEGAVDLPKRIATLQYFLTMGNERKLDQVDAGPGVDLSLFKRPLSVSPPAQTVMEADRSATIQSPVGGSSSSATSCSR